MGDEDGAMLSDGQQLQRCTGDEHAQFVDGGGGSGGDVMAMGWCDAKLPATAANVAAALVIVVIAWSVLYVNVTPELMIVPNGSLSSIFILYVTGTLAGWIINKVAGLPPRFGMLLAGIALQNAGLYNVTGWYSQLVSTVRYAYR